MKSEKILNKLSSSMKSREDDDKYRDTIDDKKELMVLNRFISNKITLAIIGIVIFTVLLLCFNYAVNVISKIPELFGALPDFNEVSPDSNSILFQNNSEITKMLSASNFFKIKFDWYIAYIIFVLIVGIMIGKLLYKIRISYSDLNIGQKGTERWTTRAEIREQYKAIPEKKEEYEGGGGFLVAREKDVIYIDDSPVNNLIIGITRSGKGEMVVFPTIDIYSRAEKKASMIITDPKLELAAGCIPTLEKRGYECHVLNLIDPEYSMGFNPLTLIIEAYKDKDYAQAEMLCSSFCYSIFNPDEGEGDSQFWANNSTYLLSALILAHIDDCLKEDEELNAKLKIQHDINEKIKEKELLEKAIEKLPGAKKAEYRRIREVQRYINEEKYSLDEVASVCEISVEEVCGLLRKKLPKLKTGYRYTEYIPVTDNEKKINMYSIINTFSTLAGQSLDEGTSLLDEYFNNRPSLDRAKLLYSAIGIAGGKTKGSIFSNTLSKLNIFTYEKIAKMTAESTIDLSDIGFGRKPVAIFIGIPDYDRSNHFIASVFIRQLYFTLAKLATAAPNGKCYREVIFILDEFGNLPAIEAMANIITVCLGRNIRFNLIIQSYSQIEKLYGKDSETIIGNCGNQMYILTNDSQTAEHFSDLIGHETVVNVNRTGARFSKDKSFTEMPEDKPLINKNELMGLKNGECIIKRVMKREDLNRNSVKPTPIKNLGNNRMKYRYMYLADDFNPDMILYDSPNMRKIISRINTLRTKEGLGVVTPKFADVCMESTDSIDIKSRVFDVERYILKWSHEQLSVTEAVSETDFQRLCDLLNLDDESIEQISGSGFSVKDGIDLVNTFYEGGYIRKEESAMALSILEYK